MYSATPPAESMAKINLLPFFVLCIRDSTDPIPRDMARMNGAANSGMRWASLRAALYTC
jgi:hypothetical protein